MSTTLFDLLTGEELVKCSSDLRMTGRYFVRLSGEGENLKASYVSPNDIFMEADNEQ